MLTAGRGKPVPDRLDALAVAVSVAFHILLLLFMPGLGPLAPKVRPEWVEVTLVEPPEASVKQIETSGTRATGGEPADGEALGDSVLFPAPPVWLPEQLAPPEDAPVTGALFLPGELLPDIAGTGTAPSGLPEAVPEHRGGAVPEIGTPPEPEWHPGETAQTTQTDRSSDVLAIEGPAARRRILYRPPPPHLTVKTSGLVRLKFWVHPDGTVGKIVPEVRGDPQLEQAAIDYLEKWRFEPAEKTHSDQWGILPIRFKME